MSHLTDDVENDKKGTWHKEQFLSKFPDIKNNSIGHDLAKERKGEKRHLSNYQNPKPPNKYGQ